MAQSQFQAFPPQRIHSSRTIAQSEALDFVTDYLEAAVDDASLHPNALLTESGPISSTQGANLGLVLHNLKRFQAGLRGEHLEAELDLTNLQEDALPDSVNEEGPSGQASTTADVNGDWQDKEEFEREQEEEQGEIGQQISATQETLPGATKSSQSIELNALDKEARKKRKKEKRLQEKRQKAEKAKREKNMDK
ncbi:MAG: hypothetical protein MMC23_002199 [Stictis urceolatum]|nr:hypothetical protein [Stictis urceolata]